MCQPSILQERYAHEAIKVEVESKQVNNSQITKSGILFTNEHGIENDEEGHTQGRDTPPDIVEYIDRKDAVKEDNLDLSTLKTPVYNHTGNCNIDWIDNGRNESVPIADTEKQQ